MEAFIGTVMMWAGTYVPQGWVLCDGRQLQITQNQALFAVLGSAYGGDSRTYFNVPNLMNAFPMGGNVTGGSAQPKGNGQLTLSVANLPAHNHVAVFTPTSGGSGGNATEPTINVTATLQASSAGGTATDPNGNYLANACDPGDPSNSVPAVTYQNFIDANSAGGSLVNVAGLSVTATATGGSGGGGITGGTVAIQNTGIGQPIQVVPAYQQIAFIICANGLFPPRC